MTTHTYDDLDFVDLKPIFIPFSVGDKNYVLTQASAGSVTEFRCKMSRCNEIMGDHILQRDLAALEPWLISQNCYVADAKDKTKPSEKLVTEAIVKAWAYQVHKAVYNKLFRISHIRDEDAPIKAMLEKALLESQGAPCNLIRFKEWVKSLDKKEFRVLREYLLDEDEDDTAKN